MVTERVKLGVLVSERRRYKGCWRTRRRPTEHRTRRDSSRRAAVPSRVPLTTSSRWTDVGIQRQFARPPAGGRGSSNSSRETTANTQTPLPLSARCHHAQWSKCHWIQGNAVLAPPVIEIQHSHTSNFTETLEGPQPPVVGPKVMYSFLSSYFPL